MPKISFDKREQQHLAEAVRAGRSVMCPHCNQRLDRRAVPPRGDVSYVRDRVWLHCGSCQRSAMVDIKTAG